MGRKIYKILALIAIVELFGVVLGNLADEPEHLLDPDFDCPICLAIQSQALVTEGQLIPQVGFLFSEPVQISEPAQYLHFGSVLVSIRAPPHSQ